MDQLAPAHVHPPHRTLRHPDPELPLHDERKATLSDLARHEGDSFGYEYDFGDSWEHDILLEKLIAAEPGGRYPACVAGERACPPEDCGGTPGYEELIDILADPGHDEHEDMLRWLGIDNGHDFDPARFDVDDANRRLDATVLAASRIAWQKGPPGHGQEATNVFGVEVLAPA